MHTLIKNDDVDGCRQLLDSYSDQHLFMAAYYCSVNVLKLFIETGKYIHARDESGDTILHIICASGEDDDKKGAMLEFVLSTPAITLIDVSNRYRRRPIMCINSNFINLSRMLIDAGASIDEKADQIVISAVASTGGDSLESLKYLMSRGITFTSKEMDLTLVGLYDTRRFDCLDYLLESTRPWLHSWILVRLRDRCLTSTKLIVQDIMGRPLDVSREFKTRKSFLEHVFD